MPQTGIRFDEGVQILESKIRIYYNKHSSWLKAVTINNSLVQGRGGYNNVSDANAQMTKTSQRKCLNG